MKTSIKSLPQRAPQSKSHYLIKSPCDLISKKHVAD
jgi:hypothetical protein